MKTTLIAFGVAATAFFSVCSAFGAENPAQPTEGGTVQAVAVQANPPSAKRIVLLRNGQILEGTVEQDGDFYHVRLADGEIRIRTSEAEFVGNDMEACYQFKRGQIQADGLQGHLALAQWCQRQKLYEHAAAELADAASISPNNGSIAILQRRLKMAQEPFEETTPAAAKDPDEPTLEQLDNMVRDLPPQAVEAFTQHIQPLLLNQCMSSGCHGSQATTTLKLQRPSSNQPASRRMTQRNLYATLKLIDRANPLSSPLLSAHAPTKGTAVSDRQSIPHQKLVCWALMLGVGSGGEANFASQPLDAFSQPASTGESPRRLSKEGMQARPLSGSGRPASKPAATNPFLPADYQEPVAGVEQAPPANAVPAELPTEKDAKTTAKATDGEGQGSASRVKRGVPKKLPEGKDPFDPDVFNRRHEAAAKPIAAQTEKKAGETGN